MQYVPMMLRNGWVLERYLGWTVRLHRDGTLKLLERRWGPLRRHLLVVREVDDDTIVDVIKEHRLLGSTCETRIEDLDGRGPPQWGALQPSLEPVAENRLLGVGTLVVELVKEEKALWDGMAKRARNMCRRAEGAGVHVECLTHEERCLAEFHALYAPLAARARLQMPPRGPLLQMTRSGELLVVVCRDGSGRAHSINLVYLQGDSGFYLYGARSDPAAEGTGHYAQWETIRQLKARGLLWYDLGQVPALDNASGIFLFKSSFGGAFVSYGTELRWQSRAFRLAERARALLRASPRESKDQAVHDS